MMPRGLKAGLISVMFLCIDHQNGVGVTVMPNADGTPKIWQGDIKEYEPDFSE